MIIIDRMSTLSAVSLSSGNSDPQLEIFSHALQKARLDEMKFNDSPQPSNKAQIASNPMLKAANDLETAGLIVLYLQSPQTCFSLRLGT
jgi:hypothetical protein